MLLQICGLNLRVAVVTVAAVEALPWRLSSGTYKLTSTTCLAKQIQAHRAPLAAMALSADGYLLATASEQGTVIRVHVIPQAAKVMLLCFFRFADGP